MQTFLIVLLALLAASFGSASVFAGEGMPGMPMISPKKTYTIPSKEAGEELQESRGYGDQEPMVRMMTLMMVGGSGYEGMSMNQMNKMEGSHAHSAHEMASNMGSESMEGMNMEGMNMAPAHPTAKTPSPAEGQTATDDVQTKITPDPPVAGPNILEITVQNKNTHQPVRNLKIKAQVFMTSMDMGITEPRVKEIAPGRYRVKVVFAMAGTWAIKLSLADAGEKVLNYQVVAKR